MKGNNRYANNISINLALGNGLFLAPKYCILVTLDPP